MVSLTSHPQILTHLAGIASTSVDRALTAALPTADLVSVRHIARLVLKRGDPPSLILLVTYFDQLPDELQEELIGSVTELYAPMRQAVQMHNGRGPANVVEIIRRARAGRLAYLVLDQLVHGLEPQLRIDAATCLLQLAQSCVEPGSGYDPATVGYVRNAMEQAASCYASHGQDSVLLAMAVLSPCPMQQWLGPSGHRHNAVLDQLRVQLQRAHWPQLRQAMFAWVIHPLLSQHVLVGIRRAVSKGHLSDLLLNAHLLIDHRVVVKLSKLRTADRLVPSDLAQWPSDHGCGLARWIAALPLGCTHKIQQLSRLTQLPSRLARLIALRELMRIRGKDLESANQAISQFCLDKDVRLARIALRYLLCCRWSGVSVVLLQLVNSQHAVLQRLAVDQLATWGFEKLWLAWSKLNREQQLHAGRALIKIDPTFHQALGRKLVNSDRGERLRAMVMINALNQGDFFEKTLGLMVKDQDPRITSAAVRTLGSSSSMGSIKALTQALSHGNPRVRANAVEALSEQGKADCSQQLIRMAKSESNRVRANAIRALLQWRIGEAVSALGEMLQDHRAKHRISALWLVESLGLISSAGTVAEMSITDRDPWVKKRAGRVVQHLIKTMQASGPAFRQRKSFVKN